MTLALDLCAGAGGLSLGLGRAGFGTLGVESDPDAVETHRRHVGACELADITTWHPPGTAVLVAGGVPCQPFSAAGLREGTRDPRGLLYRSLIRIAVEAQADVVLLENVRGMLTWRDHDGTRAIVRFESEMRAAGYEPVHALLDASDYGTPQRRVRIFVVGLRGAARAAWRWPAPTHGAPGNLFGLPRWRTVRDALGLAGAYEHGRDEGAVGWNGMRWLDVDAPSTTIVGRNNADKLRRIDRPATTVACDPRLPRAGHHDRQQSGAVRLSAEQCALLQGFPAGWTWSGGVGSQHRQIGNAVPPQLGEALGRAVLAAAGCGARRDGPG